MPLVQENDLYGWRTLAGVCGRHDPSSLVDVRLRPSMLWSVRQLTANVVRSRYPPSSFVSIRRLPRLFVDATSSEHKAWEDFWCNDILAANCATLLIAFLLLLRLRILMCDCCTAGFRIAESRVYGKHEDVVLCAGGSRLTCEFGSGGGVLWSAGRNECLGLLWRGDWSISGSRFRALN